MKKVITIVLIKIAAIILICIFSAIVKGQTVKSWTGQQTIAAMKAYAGSATACHVTANNQDYDTCNACTADEIYVFAGTGSGIGRKWKQNSDSLKKDYSDTASYPAGYTTLGNTKKKVDSLGALIPTSGSIAAKADTFNIAQSANYIISKIGTTYYARPRIGSGLPIVSSLDAYTVIQGAIDNLTPTGGIGTGPYGGKIYITAGTYVLTNELHVVGWEGAGFSSNGPYSNLIIQGDGWATYIKQSTTGKNGIVITNAAAVRLRDFRIEMGGTSRSCILADSTGADNEASMYKGEISNVYCYTSNTTYPAIYLRNFILCDFEGIFAENYTGTGMILENASYTHGLAYGNSRFGLIHAYGSSTYAAGTAGLIIRSTSSVRMNLNTFQNVGCSHGYYGIWLSNAGGNTFEFVDIEGVPVPIYFGDQAANNVVMSGYLFPQANDTAISCSALSSANNFYSLSIEDASSNAHGIVDLSNFARPNSFNDFLFLNSTTPTRNTITNPATKVTYASNANGGTRTSIIPGITFPLDARLTPFPTTGLAIFDSVADRITFRTASTKTATFSFATVPANTSILDTFSKSGTVAMTSDLTGYLLKSDSIGNTGFRSVGSANKTRDSLGALITTAGSQSLQAVTNVGNVTTKSIYADSLIASNHSYLKKTLLIGNSSYVSSLGTQIISNGNSITNNGGASSALYGYIADFASTYNIGQGGIINHAIGGSVIDTFFSYTTASYITSVRYITNMWGVNEITAGWDTGRYHTAYKKVIDTLIAKGYPLSKIVIIQETPTVNASGVNFAKIDSITAVEKGVRFVPLYYYAVANKYINFCPDGLHPNDAGHNFIANRIISVLNDSDVTGINRTLNLTSTGLLNASVVTANSGSFANDIQVSRMFLGNNGDTMNAFLGFRVGRFNTTGTNNTFLGAYTGFLNSSGSQNTAIGNESFVVNSTGSNNTTVGYLSLYNNTTGTYNTAFGINSLNANTTGGSNTAMGSYSLATNTAGIQNTAVGYSALTANITGNNNVAIGKDALRFNTTGSNNTAGGQAALFLNTTGSQNTVFGQGLVLNTTGSNNTAFGDIVLYNNTTGIQNSGMGQNALNANTTGNYNTASGAYALSFTTIGAQNTAYGQAALNLNISGSQNTGIGQNAGYNNKGNANLFLGYNTMLAYNSNNAANIFHTIFIKSDNGSDSTAGTTNLLAIGNTTPTSMFNVGTSNQFQVNSTGNIVKLNNVTTSFPSSQGAANSVLSNDGSGNLSWTNSFTPAYVAKTGTYTATASDYTIDCTANTFTVTIPVSTLIAGRIYNIANSGAGTITIATTSPDTFKNVAGTPTTLTLSPVGNYQIQATGSGWLVL